MTLGEVVLYAEDIVFHKATRRGVILSDEHGAYIGLAHSNPAHRNRHANAFAIGAGLNTNG